MTQLSCDKIEKLISFEMPVFIFDETDSTNERAKALKEGAVFALKQTAGRGRKNRTFVSERGGLYFSLVLPKAGDEVLFGGKKTRFLPERITVSAGVAVAKTLIDLSYDARIKWVNDVYVGGKKVCGILAEGMSDKIILGIGLNLASPIPEELTDKAASLDFTGDFNTVAANIINSFAMEMSALDVEFLNSHCITLGKTVKTQFGIGKAVRINERGALIVKAASEQEVFYGEAEIVSN